MTLERRHTIRDKVCLAAFVSVEGGAGNTIVNLSESGMGLQVTPSATLSAESSSPSEVRLSIDLPATQSSIEARGVVTWSDAKGRAGVRFVNLAEGPRRLLREFLSLNAAAEENRSKPSDVPQQNALYLGHTEDEEALPNAEADPGPDSSGTVPAISAVPAEAGSEEISDAALQIVVGRARALTNASGAALALLEDDVMVCRAVSGESVPPVGARLGLGTGISAECVRRRAILRCDDAEKDPGVDREACRALGIRSLVVVPVMQGTKVVGVLEVVSAVPEAFAGYGQAGFQLIIDQILTGRDLPPFPNGAENDSPAAFSLSDSTGDNLSSLPAPELLNQLRLPDSWIIRNRIVLGAVAGTILGLVILSISARLQHRAAADVEVSPPAITASASPAMPTETFAQQPKRQVSKGLNQIEKLAGTGDAEAEFSLGARYATGEQVGQDYAEAVKWFSKSAEQGHVVAQAALGACYWAGRGVPQDYVRSYMWSSLAKLGGDEASKYRVAVLRPRMSNTQVAEAQQLVQEWLRHHPQRAATLSPTAQIQP